MPKGTEAEAVEYKPGRDGLRLRFAGPGELVGWTSLSDRKGAKRLEQLVD
jgi:hypothetical protein